MKSLKKKVCGRGRIRVINTRINSGASLLFHHLLLKRHATANKPAIVNITSNPAGVGVGVITGVGVGVGLRVGAGVRVDDEGGVGAGVGCGLGGVNIYFSNHSKILRSLSFLFSVSP